MTYPPWLKPACIVANVKLTTRATCSPWMKQRWPQKLVPMEMGEEEDEAVGSKLKCWIFCKTWAATSSTMEPATGLITSTGGAVLGVAAGATAGLELVGTGGGAEDDEGLDIYIYLKGWYVIGRVMRTALLTATKKGYGIARCIQLNSCASRLHMRKSLISPEGAAVSFNVLHCYSLPISNKH